MKTPHFRKGAAYLFLPAVFCQAALASTWYWDANGAAAGVQQASGTWKNGDSTWWDSSGDGATVAWNNDADPLNIAHFGTSAGVGPTSSTDANRTITIDGEVKASELILNASGSGYSYILSGGTLALVADGENAPTIRVAGTASGTDVNRRHRIDSIISGNNINITRSTATSTNLAMLRLAGNNTWTGTLTLSSASTDGLFVEAHSGNALNTLSTVTVGANTMMILVTADEITPNFSITGNGAVSRAALRFDTDGGKVSGNVTLTGDATIASATGVTGTVSGNIGESGSGRVLTINRSNNGIVTLSGANTHTGGTTLAQGTLNINSATALGTGNFTITGGTINNSSAAAITLSTNNTQTWNGNFTFAGTNSLDLGTGAVSLGSTTGSRTVTVTANTLTVGGIISNGTATGLAKAGAGTLVLSGANTYTGMTTVSAGTLQLSGSGKLGGGALTVSGGTLNLNGTSQTVGVVTQSGGTIGTTANRGTLTGTSYTSSTGTINANLAGSGVVLTKTGTGTLTLTGANTFSGGLWIKEGMVTGNTSANAFGAGTITLGDSSTPTAAATLNVNLVTANAVTNAIVLSPGVTAALTISSPNTGTNSVATLTGGVTGANNLVLSHTGTVVATAGIRFHTGSLNNAGTITNAGTGTGTVTIDSVIGSNVTGVIQNSATSALALGGANTFSGGVTLNAGTLNINNAKALGTGTLTIAGGTTINNNSGSIITLSEANAQIWNGDFTYTGSNTLNLGTGAVSLGTEPGTARQVTVSALTLTVGGVISDGTEATGLTKAGAGTLVLSGANTYTGLTTVSEGRLNVTGSVASAVTVAAGATLDGRGTIGGAAVIEGSHVAGGGSIGTQTFSTTLTYAENSSFTWDLSLANWSGEEYAWVPGTDFDLINVGGELSVAEGTTFNIVVTGSTDFGDDFWLSDHSWEVFDAASYTGAFTDFVLYTSAMSLVDYTSYGYFTFDNSGTLSWTAEAVPEPGNALAGLLIAAGLCRRYRGRGRKRPVGGISA